MTDWPAVRAARDHDAAARIGWFVAAAAGDIELGSVARAHVQALRRWSRWLQFEPQRIRLVAPREAWSEVFAQMNAALRSDGLIRAWRDEPFTLYSTAGQDLGVAIERAAARFWGTLTLGAHCNSFVADATGTPRQLWIARRSPTKATDPGKLDNLIGGGVAAGQTPQEAVVREGWEEAGLTPAQMTGLQRGGIVRLLRDIPEGLQREWIHVFDLALPVDTTPRNQDGEVAALELRACPDALALAAGLEMTVDAALVTLDFALRRRLLPPAQHTALAAACAPWWTSRVP
jgi:8-oxo-dGTP pyrophosphatase MutT (NUDIX family)